MKRFLFLIMLTGCGDSGELAAMRTAFENAKETVVSEQKATSEKTTEAVVILKENTAALARIETKLEASLAKSEPQNGKDGDPASAPEPPATANNTPNSSQVATPAASSRVASDGTVLRWNVAGDWNPTILETSAHLTSDHGINTNGMTHQEMADLHASIHDGKPVAMKSEAVRYVSRGTNCPNGQCPTSSTRYVRRSRR
jgi:hypothetical protein